MSDVNDEGKLLITLTPIKTSFSLSEPKLAKDRWVIELIVGNEHDALLAYDAIEKLLVEMGEIGTLCLARKSLRNV